MFQKFFKKQTLENVNLLLFLMSIASIFLSRFKIYPVLFMATAIFMGLYIWIFGGFRFTKVQKYMFLFCIWALFTTAIHSVTGFYNPSKELILKFTINICFFIVSSIYITQLENKNLKKYIIYTIEAIIIANFVQLIYIYINHGLFVGLLRGDFRNSSDAYIITSFSNILGAENKNIWASKVALTQAAYYFAIISGFNQCKRSFSKKVLMLAINALTILMLLSRTSQVAMMIPYIFVVFSFVNGKDFYKKYKKYIIAALSVVIILAGAVFFKKFFHLKLDMNDGGLTRVYIWVKFFSNMFQNTAILFGRGLGYAAHFVEHVVKRSESNLHNVILNITLEQGIIGATLYMAFIVSLFKEVVNKKNIVAFGAIVLVPFLTITTLQYLGYDNDLVLFFLLLYIFKSKGELNGRSGIR